MKRQAMFLISTLIAAIALADDDGPRDGNFWRPLNQGSKFTYLVGVFDGVSLGLDLTCRRDRDDAFTDKVWTSLSQQQCKYFENVTNGQIADGLNIFYDDFRNRKITITNALWIVLNQIAGKTHREIQAMILEYRKPQTTSD